MGDGQHTWAAAEWILMMRNCFLREEPANGKLVIGAGILPQWLDAGHSLSIGPAPTFWGPVDVALDVSADAVHVRCTGRWRRERPGVEIRMPGCESGILPGDRGDVRLRRLTHGEARPGNKDCARSE
jgi:hypothetical protein